MQGRVAEGIGRRGLPVAQLVLGEAVRKFRVVLEELEGVEREGMAVDSG